MFVQPGSYESMISLDQNGAGEILAEIIDGGPTNNNSSHQQPETHPPDNWKAGVNAPNVGEPKNHSKGFD